MNPLLQVLRNQVRRRKPAKSYSAPQSSSSYYRYSSSYRYGNGYQNRTTLIATVSYQQRYNNNQTYNRYNNNTENTNR